MRKNDEKKSSWLLRVIIFLGIILSGLVIFAVSKEIYIKKEVQKQIDQLDTEAQKIEKENMALSDKISYLESKDYQEKEAKDKLNLQDPGENVVVIKPSLVAGQKNDDESPIPDKKLIVKVSNVQKWWDYLFK